MNMNMSMNKNKNKKNYETVEIQFIDFREEKIETTTVSVGNMLPGDENVNIDDLF